MSIGSRLAAWFGCDQCAKMHRRAQEAESLAARTVRQSDHARLWRTVMKFKIQRDYWKRRLRYTQARLRVALSLSKAKDET